MIRGRSTPRAKRLCSLSEALTPPERFVETSIKRELEMNYVKYQQIEGGLTGISKKILNFVPLSESWTRHRITAEIERQSHARVDPRTCDGVLAGLVDSGLVKEPKRGEFMRIPVPQPEKAALALRETVAAPSPPKEKVLPIPATKENALDKIGHATSSLRQLAKQIEETASVIDDAAIASQQESQKMRQLSELLKSING